MDFHYTGCCAAEFLLLLLPYRWSAAAAVAAAAATVVVVVACSLHGGNFPVSLMLTVFKAISRFSFLFSFDCYSVLQVINTKKSINTTLTNDVSIMVPDIDEHARYMVFAHLFFSFF